MKKRHYLGVLVFFLYLISGCSSWGNKEVWHPLPERLPKDAEMDWTISLDEPSSDSLLPFMYKDHLSLSAVIGDEKNVEREYIRLPNKIDIDPEGYIYVVNTDRNKIDVYNPDGTFFTSIGRWGRGPGEFLDLTTFDFDAQYERLYALDQLKVEVFERSGNNFEYRDTFFHRLNEEAIDLCLLDSSLYISGFTISTAEIDSIRDLRSKAAQIEGYNSVRATKPIAVFDLKNFEQQHNFGYQYTSMSGFGGWTGIMSATILNCDERGQTIIITLPL
ncbi:MAG: 6-bladed beta-propeller [Balneolaceae bacterium]|nr:6-bladed beta-propeller [Balneolaceae bacterium]